MKLVVISDTHSQHYKLKLPDGDVLVHAGDFSNRGKESEVTDFAVWLREQPFKYKVVIPGNHDWLCEREPIRAREIFQGDGIHYLVDEAVELDGIKFYGSPWQPEFANWAFNLPRGEPLRRVWRKIPGGTDVLVTHGPPSKILDRTEDGDHTGCVDLLNTICGVIRPQVSIFGHIHEARGVAMYSGIKFINAAMCDARNRLLNQPIEVEVNVRVHDTQNE